MRGGVAVLRTGFCFDTSPLPGWRMQSQARVCELVLSQPVAQPLIAFAINFKHAFFRGSGTVLLARFRS
jgi:hypothetical protein